MQFQQKALAEQQQMVSNTAISNNTDAITAEVFSQSG
jgi:hypothetical protein